MMCVGTGNVSVLTLFLRSCRLKICGESSVPVLTRLEVGMTRREGSIMPTHDVWGVKRLGFDKVGCGYDEKMKMDHTA